MLDSVFRITRLLRYFCSLWSRETHCLAHTGADEACNEDALGRILHDSFRRSRREDFNICNADSRHDE